MKKPDKNLALISIILGGASFTNTIFTGIPAIILGIVALKKNAGDRTQAKLGILFGAIGSLLLIPIILVAAHFLKAPLNEQFSVSQDDRTYFIKMVDDLEKYKDTHKSYPKCTPTDSEQTCSDWVNFLQESSTAKKYPVVFEVDANTIESRPAGTVVYAQNTSCFVNTPVHPNTFDDSSSKPKNTEDYVAIVYFHQGGRACFSDLEK